MLIVQSMSLEKQSLMDEASFDSRVLFDLLQKFDYTLEEVSNAINMHEPFENNQIHDIENIEILLTFYPNAHISNNTLNAIKHSFPDRFQYILDLQKNKQINKLQKQKNKQ